MIARGAFVEWARVHGHLYGTSQLAIDERLRSGQDIVLEIDWQGALQIRQRFAEAVLIFILPPSWQELQQRLLRRGEDGAEVIEQRLANARSEVEAMNKLRAQAEKTIVHSQRLKYAAQARLRPQVFAALDLH